MNKKSEPEGGWDNLREEAKQARWNKHHSNHDRLEAKFRNHPVNNLEWLTIIKQPTTLNIYVFNHSIHSKINQLSIIN